MALGQVVDLRHLAARELDPLLKVESQEWQATLRWDYAASARLIASCVEEKRLAGYALTEGSQITGYSFFFYEGEKGLIGNLYAEPGPVRLRRALLLLEHVIETLLATPGLGRVETQLPHFAMEELEPRFRGHGFAGYLRRFMAAPLPDARPHPAATSPRVTGHPPAVSHRDFQIEPWERRHDLAAASLVFNTYRQHVDACINDQYDSQDGATRLIENIVHHRGCGEHLPHASLVAIHRPTQKLAGVLALTAVGKHTAHIPQIAVAPEFQGTGLGTALLSLSFADLAQRGYREVSLTVTDRNTSAVRLYERLGFETFSTFGAFVWNAS